MDHLTPHLNRRRFIAAGVGGATWTALGGLRSHARAAAALAERVELSDVGLKKVLQSHGVSTPPQGYWNKIAAGQPVPQRPRAPDRRPGESGRIRLHARFAKVLKEAPLFPVDGPFASRFVPEALDELKALELAALRRVSVPRDLQLAHPGLSRLLKRQARQREKYLASAYDWNKPSLDGPFDQRRLRFLNGLFLALAKRGHSGDAYEHDYQLQARAFVGSTSISILVDVAGKRKNDAARQYNRPAADLPAATPLALSIDSSFRGSLEQTWQDDETGKIESKLAEIAASVIVAGEASFRRGLREHLRWLEEMRLIKERRRREQLAALEAKRLEHLRTSGELLRQAEDIRSLVLRLKTAVLSGEKVLPPDDLAAWEAWATDYADRIDPIKSGQFLSHLAAPTLPED